MSTSISRDELYTLVWSEPIQKLAKRFNISDRGLGKLCTRHGIPVPPRGWWARKAAGYRVRQASSPPLPAGQNATITIRGQQQQKPKPEPVAEPPLQPEIAFERDPANRIIVDANARLTHRLIRDAAAELRSRRADQDGIVHTPPGCLDLRVSKASISRALRIFQGLIRGLESRGYGIEVKEGKTLVTVLGESYRVFMKERLRRIVRDLTPEQHRQRREGLAVDPYELELTGELAFHVDDPYPKRSTADGKRKRLEDSLNLFLGSLLLRAFADKAQREERGRQEQQRREAERKREEARKRQREHEALIDRFDTLAAAWAKTEQRRTFLARLRETVESAEPGSPLGQWLTTAEHWTEVSDPMAPFKKRDERLKLYYGAYRYQIAEVRERGFEDPVLSEKTPTGIHLRDRRPDSDWMSESIEVELPGDVALPYEVTKPGFVPRTFYVPARVLNKAFGRANTSTLEEG